jgi:hypothetical protein
MLLASLRAEESSVLSLAITNLNGLNLKMLGDTSINPVAPMLVGSGKVRLRLGDMVKSKSTSNCGVLTV